MSFISFVHQNSSQSECEFKATVKHRAPKKLKTEEWTWAFRYAQIQRAFLRLKSVWIKCAFDCSIFV